MRTINTIILFLVPFVCLNAFGADNDSLFIDSVKKFAFKEFGTELKGDFFTKWSNEDKPYIYLYISLPDKIEQPTELNSDLHLFGTDEDAAKKEASEYIGKGYYTLCYKTYANSATLLNKRLLSYSKEAQSFIIFHELTHNYLGQMHINVPYDFNESLCDVMGNYGTLLYSQATSQVDLAAVKNQTKSNERIYTYINLYINKINRKPGKERIFNNRCYKAIHKILKSCNRFQKDRFDYICNNAYLLRNQYYCRNYFLLKKVFLKQKTRQAFLKLIKNMPGNSGDCRKYFEKFL